MWPLQEPSPAVAGLLLQLGSTFCVSLMSLVAKLCGQMGVPVMEIVLARSLVLLGLSTAMLGRQGRQAAWPWKSARRWLLLLRGCLGLGAITSLYWAVQLLPLAEASVLTFLAPVLVAVAAPLFLGERTGRAVALALALCVLGVLLVAQPRALFGRAAEALSMLGVALALAQAGFSAAAKLCIRSLGSTEPTGSIIFAMAAVSTAGSAFLCAALPHQLSVPPSAAAWALLVAAGLLGCGVQLLNTTALKLSRAAPTVAMSYAAVVWGLIFDLAIFHHRPSPLSLLGAALVCASSLLIVLDEQQASKAGGGAAAGGSSKDQAAEQALLLLSGQLKAKSSGVSETAVAASGGQFSILAGPPGWQERQQEGAAAYRSHGEEDARQLELAERGVGENGTAADGGLQGGMREADDERAPLMAGPKNPG